MTFQELDAATLRNVNGGGLLDGLLGGGRTDRNDAGDTADEGNNGGLLDRLLGEDLLGGLLNF